MAPYNCASSRRLNIKSSLPVNGTAGAYVSASIDGGALSALDDDEGFEEPELPRVEVEGGEASISATSLPNKVEYTASTPSTLAENATVAASSTSSPLAVAPPAQSVKRKISSPELAPPKRLKSSEDTGDEHDASLPSTTLERNKVRPTDSVDHQDAEYVIFQLRCKPYIYVHVDGKATWKAGLISYPCLMYLRLREALPIALVQQYDAYIDTLSHSLFYELLVNNNKMIKIEHDEAIAALEKLLDVPNMIKYIIRSGKKGSKRLLRTYIAFETHMITKIRYIPDTYATTRDDRPDRRIDVGEDVGDGLRPERPQGEDVPVIFGVTEYVEWDFVQCRYVDKTYPSPLNYRFDDRSPSIITYTEDVRHRVLLDTHYIDVILEDVLADLKEDYQMTIDVGDRLFTAPRVYDICMGYLGIRGTTDPTAVEIYNRHLVDFSKGLLLGLAQTKDSKLVTVRDRKAANALLSLASLPWRYEQRCMAGREYSNAGVQALWNRVRIATAKPGPVLTLQSVMAAIPAEGIREGELEWLLRVPYDMRPTFSNLLWSVASPEPEDDNGKFFLYGPSVHLYSGCPSYATAGSTGLEMWKTLLADLVDWTAADKEREVGSQTADKPGRRHYGVLCDMVRLVRQLARRALKLRWKGVTIRLLTPQQVLKKRCYRAEDVVKKLATLLYNYYEMLYEYSELPYVTVNPNAVNPELGRFINMLADLTNPNRYDQAQLRQYDAAITYMDEGRVVIDEAAGSRWAWEAAALIMKTGGLLVPVALNMTEARVAFWRCFGEDEV
ncbi:hypothetical protein LTR65_006151 [Meristemomyces frigidus]